MPDYLDMASPVIEPPGKSLDCAPAEKPNQNAERSQGDDADQIGKGHLCLLCRSDLFWHTPDG